MLRFSAAAVALTLAASPAFAAQTQFWNLTVDAIVRFQLSPPGKDAWGLEQTKNDKDGSVDPDERLTITETPAGVYDVKFTDKKGRTCTVQNVKVEAGKIFSIEEKDLKNCTQ